MKALISIGAPRSRFCLPAVAAAAATMHRRGCQQCRAAAADRRAQQWRLDRRSSTETPEGGYLHGQSRTRR